MLKRISSLSFLTFLVAHTPGLANAEAEVLKEEPTWICSEIAIIREGDRYLVCGIGQSATESEARIKAIEHAQREFDKLCSLSSDCQGREVNLQPARTDCRRMTDGLQTQCRRAIYYELGRLGARIGQDTTALENDIESLEEQIELRKKQLELTRQSRAQREELKKLEHKLRTGDLGEDRPRSAKGQPFFSPDILGRLDPPAPWSLQCSFGLLPSRPYVMDRSASSGASLGGLLQRRLFDRLGVELEFKYAFNGYKPDKYRGEMDAGPGFVSTLWNVGIPIHFSADPYSSWSITPTIGRLNATITTATAQDEAGLIPNLDAYSVSTYSRSGMTIGATLGYLVATGDLVGGWRTGISFLTPTEFKGWTQLGVYLSLHGGFRF